MKFTYQSVDDDGDEVTVELPGRYEVCPRCRGRGSHVNPAIDGNGISTSDECWQDDDFREGYLSGLYDVSCERCDGLRVVMAPDVECLADGQRAAWEQHQREEYEYEAERASEMRWGY